jgi:hypothetical protein
MVGVDHLGARRSRAEVSTQSSEGKIAATSERSQWKSAQYRVVQSHGDGFCFASKRPFGWPKGGSFFVDIHRRFDKNLLYMEIRRPPMRLDLKQNIEFPFSDPGWAMKLLKTSLCMLLVLPLFAVTGYQIAIVREAANGEDESLPEFDFGPMWIKGLIFYLVFGLVVAVPSISVGTLMVGGVMAAGVDPGNGLGLVLGILCCLGLVAFIVSIFMPALMLRYAMTESAASILNIRAALNDMKQGPADYALIFFFPVLVMIVTLMLSVTGIGAILSVPLSVLGMLVQARMLGNYYRAYFH